MAKSKEEILVEIAVSGDKALTALNKHSAAVRDLKKENKDLENQLKELNTSDKNYAETKSVLIKQINLNKIAITEESKAEREYQKIIQNNIVIEKEKEGSIKAMAAQLSNLRNEYDKMSREQKSSTEIMDGARISGIELQKEIESLANAYDLARKEEGLFQQGVGNYPETVGASTKSLRDLKKELKELRDEQAKVTGKEFDELGKKINDVEGKIGDLNDAFKTQVGTAMEQTNAGLKLIQEGIVNLDFDKIKIGLGGVKISALAASVGMAALTSAMTLGLSQILQWLPSLDKLKDMFFGLTIENNRFINAQKSLAEETKYVLQEEQDLIKAQEDRIKINLALGKSTKENEEFILKAKLDSYDKQKEINEDELRRLYVLQERREKAGKELNEDEIKRKNELQTWLIYFNTNRAKIQKDFDLQEQLQQIDKEKKLLELAKQAKQRHLDFEKEYRNSIIALMQDGTSKEIAQIQENAKQTLAELKEKYKGEVEIQKLISNIELKLKQDTEALKQAYADETVKKNIAEQKQSIKNQLELVEKGSWEELNLKRNFLKLEKQERLNARSETNEDLFEIEEVFNKRIEQLNLDYVNSLWQDEEKKREEYIKTREFFEEQERLKVEAARQAAYDMFESLSELASATTELTTTELAQRQKRYERVTALNNAEYTAKIAAINNEAISEQQKQQKIELARQQFEASENERNARYKKQNADLVAVQKSAALAQVAIESGVAIAKAFTAASSLPPPANLIAYVASAAAIAKGIADAKSIINSTEIPEYARGGFIEGGEKIIRVNERGQETIMNANATRMFAPQLEAMNAMGNGNNAALLNNEQLAQSIIEGIKELPPQQVSVTEINEVQQRLNVIERL